MDDDNDDYYEEDATNPDNFLYEKGYNSWEENSILAQGYELEDDEEDVKNKIIKEENEKRVNENTSPHLAQMSVRIDTASKCSNVVIGSSSSSQVLVPKRDASSQKQLPAKTISYKKFLVRVSADTSGNRVFNFGSGASENIQTWMTPKNKNEQQEGEHFSAVWGAENPVARTVISKEEHEKSQQQEPERTQENVSERTQEKELLEGTQYKIPVKTPDNEPERTQEKIPVKTPKIGHERTQEKERVKTSKIGPERTQEKEHVKTPKIGPERTQEKEHVKTPENEHERTQEKEPVKTPKIGPERTQEKEHEKTYGPKTNKVVHIGGEETILEECESNDAVSAESKYTEYCRTEIVQDQLLSSQSELEPIQKLKLQSEEDESLPKRMYHSPEKEQYPTSFPSDVTLEKIETLLKTVPFLEIPIHFGFSRNVTNTMNSDGHPTTVVVYSHKVDRKGRASQLKSSEEVHLYLCKNNLPIPISFFTFESSIRDGYTFYQSFWLEMTCKEDLSEGLENIPIPIICSKTKAPGTLAKYVSESFHGSDLKGLNIRKLEDDGFLVCCDCPNDCKEKMKCPCFLKTLDNCSNKTRELQGDENIGYKYQRLESPQLSGIFECNKKCKCMKSTCFNRVSQNGIVCRLQLFMTDLKGWGVRTLCDIPKGTFVCTYAGAIVSAEFANAVSANWNDGLWKYLSALEPSHADKEGYESDVVESDEIEEEKACSTSLQSPPQQVKNNTEIKELSNDDWKDFLQEDSCGSPPAISDSSILSSPITSQSVIGYQTGSVNIPKTSFQRKWKRNAVRPADRVLRSQNYDKETEFEPLTTGRFGFLQTSSLEEVKILSRSNMKSKIISEVHLMPSIRSMKRRKIVECYFMDDDHTGMVRDLHDHNYNDLITQMQKREKEQKIVVNPTLTRQFIIEHVMPSVKIEGSSQFLSQQQEEDNSVTDVITRVPLPSATMPFSSSSSSVTTHPPLLSTSKLSYSRIVNRITKKVRKRSHEGKNVNGVFKKKKGLGGARRRKNWALHYLRTCRKRNTEVETKHPLLKLDLNIDGIKFGNIGRYLNHSCDPNLFPQYVFVDTHDLRFPGVTFFANRNIQAGEELTWNYQYIEDEVECQEQQGGGEEHQSRRQQHDQKHGDEQQQQSPTCNHDDNDVDNNSMIRLTFPHKRLAAVVRKKVGFGKGNRRKSSKQNIPRLPCHCGQDNCSNRIC